MKGGRRVAWAAAILETVVWAGRLFKLRCYCPSYLVGVAGVAILLAVRHSHNYAALLTEFTVSLDCCAPFYSNLQDSHSPQGLCSVRAEIACLARRRNICGEVSPSSFTNPLS